MRKKSDFKSLRIPLNFSLNDRNLAQIDTPFLLWGEAWQTAAKKCSNDKEIFFLQAHDELTEQQRGETVVDSTMSMKFPPPARFSVFCKIQPRRLPEGNWMGQYIATRA